MKTAQYTRLENRGLIQIEGTDRYGFLQNLITNDMKKLKPNVMLYACLLTPQGKFLFDFFISEGNGVIFLECEGKERAEELYKRLCMYRLRSDVQISIEKDMSVYAIFGQSNAGLPDPRSPDIGRRSFEKPEEIEEIPFNVWDKKRIQLCIPDGSRDLIPENSTMDEAHMDRLGAISYDKGCYLGQELTARMHYRGLGKKHLYVVEGEKLPTFGESILTPDKKTIGEMRSSCRNIGLALIKDNETSHLTNPHIALHKAKT